MNQHIINASLESFDTDVIQASARKPVIVDFWADWCSPCHALAPYLETVIGNYDGEVILVKVEVDDGENMKLAGRYRLRGFPTVILFQDGEERGRFSGMQARHKIEEFIEAHRAD